MEAWRNCHPLARSQLVQQTLEAIDQNSPHFQQGMEDLLTEFERIEEAVIRHQIRDLADLLSIISRLFFQGKLDGVQIEWGDSLLTNTRTRRDTTMA